MKRRSLSFKDWIYALASSICWHRVVPTCNSFLVQTPYWTWNADVTKGIVQITIAEVTAHVNGGWVGLCSGWAYMYFWVECQNTLK